MDSEVHYYITLLIAKQAGFSSMDAYRIAYSAQYVDDNTNFYLVYKSKKDLRKPYRNFISQTMNLKLSQSLLQKIYICFHFLPEISISKSISYSKNRRDKKIHLLNTLAGNSLAQLLIQKALESRNPYLIGIASHAFLDTWAHQNFTGTLDSFNNIYYMQEVENGLRSQENQNERMGKDMVFQSICSMSKYSIYPHLVRYVKEYKRGAINFLRNSFILSKFPIFQALISNRIGHMDALERPDLINYSWQDSRLKCCTVSNNVRFYQAIGALLKEYQRFWSAQHCVDNIKVNHYNYLIDRPIKTYLHNQKFIVESKSLSKIAHKQFLLAIKKVLNQKKSCVRMRSYSEIYRSIDRERVKNYRASDDNNDYNLYDLVPYDKNLWLKESTNNANYCSMMSVKGVFSTYKCLFQKGIFKESNWFYFQEAVKQYQAYVWNILSNMYSSLR